MTNGQKNFYKIMHVLTIIAIVGATIGIVFLAGLWIFKPTGENSMYGSVVF